MVCGVINELWIPWLPSVGFVGWIDIAVEDRLRFGALAGENQCSYHTQWDKEAETVGTNTKESPICTMCCHFES